VYAFADGTYFSVIYNGEGMFLSSENRPT